ncbi:MAG: helix-turn-helix domain-containing protein [Smithella sp.]|jgi:excisionase family DNA binding protein
MDNINDQQLYTISEAAELLRVNPITIRRWSKEGKINIIRIFNGKPRITKAEMDRVLKEFSSHY